MFTFADPKDFAGDRKFLPQLIAPYDVFPQRSKSYYWRKAIKDCFVWRDCYSAVMDGKAYFCELGPMMDKLFDEDHGWSVHAGEYPYRRTNAEIAAQAEHYCYRCGCLFSAKDLKRYKIPTQFIRDKTLVSKTCWDSIHGVKKHLVQWDPS